MPDETRGSDRDQAIERLRDAVKPILSAYRSESAHITEEQITEAWAAYDASALAPAPDPPAEHRGGDDGKS